MQTIIKGEALLAHPGQTDTGALSELALDQMIHPTAIVAPGARLGRGVVIGPWCTVGPNVVLDDNVQLVSHVVVDGHTHLADGVKIYPFVSVGLDPQDLKYKGEPTRCEIGPRTVVREHVTIHRGTATGTGLTRIGADCLIMANAHVAHDCDLGDRVIIVNNVVMGGHVHIADDVRVMGSAAIHQFVRIGRAAMIGGVTGVEADVIPYGSVMGNRARLVGLHWVWLRAMACPPVRCMSCGVLSGCFIPPEKRPCFRNVWRRFARSLRITPGSQTFSPLLMLPVAEVWCEELWTRHPEQMKAEMVGKYFPIYPVIHFARVTSHV